MSIASSTSSLLSQGRPAHLAPCHGRQQGYASEMEEGIGSFGSAGGQVESERFVSSTSTTALSHPSQPIASTSSGMRYLNMIPTAAWSDDHAGRGHVALKDRSAHSESCVDLLAAAVTRPSVLACAMPKSKWQPDDDSHLCSYPLCTTMFGPAKQYFPLSLAPRRHHCRMCGLLFCDEHSKRRIPLMQPLNDTSLPVSAQRYVTRERVCDICIAPSDPTSLSSASQPASRRQSILSTSQTSHESSTTQSSEHLYTPLSEVPSSPFTRSRSRNNLQVEVEPNPSLAPLEAWMGPGGELSLYPLAINPSNCKVTNTHLPAVPPLYAPSLATRRQRMRNGKASGGGANATWVFGRWGYKREDFDPEFDSEDENESDERGVKGGLVRDGDICFRVRGREAARGNKGRGRVLGMDSVYLKRCGSSVERIQRSVSTF